MRDPAMRRERGCEGYECVSLVHGVSIAPLVSNIQAHLVFLLRD